MTPYVITYRHYRDASDNISKLLQHSMISYCNEHEFKSSSLSSGFEIEKGSIDEWFVDVTPIVKQCVGNSDFQFKGIAYGITSSTPIHAQFRVASHIASRLRSDVSNLRLKILHHTILEQLGYTR